MVAQARGDQMTGTVMTRRRRETREFLSKEVVADDGVCKVRGERWVRAEELDLFEAVELEKWLREKAIPVLMANTRVGIDGPPAGRRDGPHPPPDG